MIDLEIAPGYPTVETPASKVVDTFISASGDHMPIHGDKIIVVKPQVESKRSCATQCAHALDHLHLLLSYAALTT